MRHEFCARLTGAVGIVSPELIDLAKGRGAIVVLIYLVARNVHTDNAFAELPQRIEEIYESKNVNRECFERITKATTNQCLTREVKHDVGRRAGHSCENFVAVSKIDEAVR